MRIRVLSKSRKEVFVNLSGEQIKTLKGFAIPLKYLEGDLLFQAGSLSDGLYLICSGFIVYGKQFKGDSQRSRIFKLLGPGEMVGEESLFAQKSKQRFGYARSIVDAKLLFFEKNDLLDFLLENPEGFHDICNYLASSMKGFEIKLLDEGYLTTDKRLARLLMEINNQWGEKMREDGPICLKLKRKILAGILGVSEGSITRILKQLQEKGLLSINNENLCIESTEGLEEFASI